MTKYTSHALSILSNPLDGSPASYRDVLDAFVAFTHEEKIRETARRVVNRTPCTDEDIVRAMDELHGKDPKIATVHGLALMKIHVEQERRKRTLRLTWRPYHGVHRTQAKQTAHRRSSARRTSRTAAKSASSPGSTSDGDGPAPSPNSSVLRLRAPSAHITSVLEVCQ